MCEIVSTEGKLVGRQGWTALLAAALLLAFPSVVTAAPSVDAEARATALFEKAAEHYQEGRFEMAIPLLEEAYALTPAPVLLYNLARAYEGNGEVAKALSAYRRYLDEAEAVTDRGAIERRVATLEAQLQERARLAREAEEAKRRAAAAERSPSPYPWLIAGVGAAGLTAGAVVAVLSGQREQEAIDEPSQIPAADLTDEARRLALGANVSFAVGGALLVGGLAWGIADVVLLGDDDDADEVSLRVNLGFGSAGLELSF